MLSGVPGMVSPLLQSAKWTVSNSSSDLVVAAPDGSTVTVAKSAALTQSVTVVALPAGAYLLSCVAKSTTAFAGTLTLTATVGITGALTSCISTPYDLKAAVSNSNLSVALPATPIVSVAGSNVILALTSTVNNITSISAGSVTIWLVWCLLP
jgi:hypothetical protein